MKFSLPPRIGLYEKALPLSMSMAEKLQTTMACGYDFFEISIDESDDFLAKLDWPSRQRRELLAQSQDLDLPLFSICLSGQRKFPMGSSSKTVGQKSRDMLAKAIDLACDLGAHLVQVIGYWVFYEPITASSEDIFLENLMWGTQRAARQGIMLGIENVDSHEQVNSISKAMQYVRQINSPWFQIYGDFANLAAFGFDVPGELKAGQGHFVSIHVKDSAPEVVRGVPLGKGVVNFIEAFNTLAGIHYSGPFLMEMWHNCSANPVKTAADSLVKIKGIMDQTNYQSNDPTQAYHQVNTGNINERII